MCFYNLKPITAWFLLFLMIVNLTGCKPSADSDAILISRLSTNKNVTNGQAYERVIFDISKYNSIMVPNSAIIQHDNSIEGKIKIYLEKKLSFVGHPPNPMNIRDARNYMGCVYKIQDKSIMIATYGEWDSKEGGAYIRMVIIAPKELELKKRYNLSGKNSIAHLGNKSTWMKLINSDQFKKCYWYGPILPDDSWLKITMEPDHNLTAKNKNS